MGNRLARVLAEIRTSHALQIAIKDFDAEIISFMFKYVDDIFTSIDENYIDSVKDEISKRVGMELTLFKEGQSFDIEFLDCTFRRNNDSTVSSRWLEKSYSCLSILSCHSYHPQSMKYTVAIEMIRKASLLTSPEFMEQTKELLMNVLRRSSYPQGFIIESLHVAPRVDFKDALFINAKRDVQYVSCPYFNPFFNITSPL